jgi:hypothetical protein
MMWSNGLRWKNKGHLISFGRMQLQPKRPPLLSIDIDKQGEEIADVVFNVQNQVEDITLVRNMGFEVGNDKEPAPENVPAGNSPPVNGGALLEGQEWGWDGIDCHAMLQGLMYNGSTFTNEWSPTANPSVKSSSTASPVISLRLPSSRQQTTCCSQ